MLNSSRTSQIWAAQLARMQWDYLMRSDLNHRHGFATVEEINQGLARLQACCATLGFELEAMTNTSWQPILNRVHTNFPEFFRHHVDPAKFHVAHEMNLLIHWLEYELANAIAGKQAYLFNLDFNHFAPAYNLKQAFADPELGFFSPVLEFGNLHLHYIHVGRHFLEMFDADDVVCPPQDFRPQQEFNATCGLVFSEPVDRVTQDTAMRAYFARRGGEPFFGYAYDAPRMAKGFFKLGQLQNVADYGTRAQRQALREQLQSADIVGWELLDTSGTVIHALHAPADTSLPVDGSARQPVVGLAGRTGYSVG